MKREQVPGPESWGLGSNSLVTRYSDPQKAAQSPRLPSRCAAVAVCGFAGCVPPAPALQLSCVRCKWISQWSLCALMFCLSVTPRCTIQMKSPTVISAGFCRLGFRLFFSLTGTSNDIFVKCLGFFSVSTGCSSALACYRNEVCG